MKTKTWLSLIALVSVVLVVIGCSEPPPPEEHQQSPPPAGFATWDAFYQDFYSKPPQTVEETVPTPAPLPSSTESDPSSAETEEPTVEEHATQSGDFTEAEVSRIIDGDTIEVIMDGQAYKVRYIGIDTAEVGDPCCAEATETNRDLVEDEVVRLEKDVSETDQYGRLLRYVYVGDTMVNAELVRLGYAQVYTYPPDVEYNEQFLDLEREARSAERGCWAPQGENDSQDADPENGQFVGSVNSDVYHYPSCQWGKKISPSNEIWFDSAADAKAQGYRPCKVCEPPS